MSDARSVRVGCFVALLMSAPVTARHPADTSPGQDQMKLAGYTRLTDAEITRQITNKSLHDADRAPGTSIGGITFCRSGRLSLLVESFLIEGQWQIRDNALCWQFDDHSQELCRTFFSKRGDIYMALEVPDPQHARKQKIVDAASECNDTGYNKK